MTLYININLQNGGCGNIALPKTCGLSVFRLWNFTQENGLVWNTGNDVGLASIFHFFQCGEILKTVQFMPLSHVREILFKIL